MRAPRKPKAVAKPVTIAELEALLNSEQDEEFTILPDGTIKQTKGRRGRKGRPLTMRENLGLRYTSHRTAHPWYAAAVGGA